MTLRNHFVYPMLPPEVPEYICPTRCNKQRAKYTTQDRQMVMNCLRVNGPGYTIHHINGAVTCDLEKGSKHNRTSHQRAYQSSIRNSIYLLPTVESRWVSSVNAMSCRIMLMQCIHPLKEKGKRKQRNETKSKREPGGESLRNRRTLA